MCVCVWNGAGGPLGLWCQIKNIAAWHLSGQLSKGPSLLRAARRERSEEAVLVADVKFSQKWSNSREGLSARWREK